MIIDAKNSIVGRMATVVAKKALMGEKVDIVNCDKAVMIGKKKEIFARYRAIDKRGDALKGPYTQKMPDRFVRRIIRGMLPYKQEKGLTAYKRVMCYIGVPDEFKGKESERIKNAHISSSNALSYVTIADLCAHLKK